jgi:tryptophanyl-tRNA synthetase
MSKTFLTGIKPTGIPHIGNYLGAIRPALELSSQGEAVYFIADYHALTSVFDGDALHESIRCVAATWLALGLDPQKAVFYKQSDVPEIFEFSWVLSCLTPKGFMNRAHAYKDKVAKNQEAGEDADAGVNMGLFSYPCLMNADILLFGADVVPVGKDQKQHVEFARDLAVKFNQTYKTDLIRIPEPSIQEETDVIPGLDGRKMSKSYDNTIELFLPSKALKKKVNKIVTNSQEIHEVKDPEICNVFRLYKLFASPEQQAELAGKYRAGGMGWGEAKNALFEVLEAHFAEARGRYDQWMANPAELDKVLAMGAVKARAKATEMMREVRRLVGVQR